MKRDSFRTTLAILALSVTLLSSLMASELSEQVIIAEYDGGKITKELLKQRLEKIPSFYRQRYETNEGKQKLLDTMCTEELFYAEAIDRNLQNDPEVEKRTKWEKTRFLFQRYKRDLIDNTQFSKDEILEYYREHEESYKAGTLEEATPDIRRKLLQENQSKIEADILDSLKTKYNVKIIHQVIDSTTIKYLEEPEKIKKDIMFVSSDSPELNYTLSEFVTLYSLIDMRSFVNIDTVKKLRDYVDRIVEMKLYYIDALANEYPAKAGL
ncbi:MAG: hypothetical protein SVM86_00860, partial [Candidatus Cloacimonadota bacterium]|nr:hypothetical protein [Candidatus Cloacimonadota bacterium]